MEMSTWIQRANFMYKVHKVSMIECALNKCSWSYCLQFVTILFTVLCRDLTKMSTINNIDFLWEKLSAGVR